jgi:hypothetical protein
LHEDKQRRPRLRWLDSVLKELKTFEVNAWWKKARDRDLGSEIIRKPGPIPPSAASVV